MSEKKVVGRNVAIAFGIIIIILLVGLVGVVANYTLIIDGKDNTITTNNSQILALTNQLNQLQTWLDGNRTYYQNQVVSKDSQITSLQNQVNDLTNTVNLAKSTVWVDDQTVSQPASSYTTWTPAFSASYAGYVSIWVQTSTTTNTYVRVIYSAYGVNYDHQIGVGTGGTAVFPLLPCSTIEIRVGNSNLFSGATETVTVTYHY